MNNPRDHQSDRNQYDDDQYGDDQYGDDQYGTGYEHDEFDQRAFAAGRSLQQSAPTEGLARVRSSYRRRRTANAVAVGAVALLFAGGIFALMRSRPAPATADLTTNTAVAPSAPTVPAAPTNTATTAPGQPAPATAVPAVTIPAPTNAAAEPATSTTAAAAPATNPAPSLGNLLFWNHMYLGYWTESGFVGNNVQPNGPDGLIGANVTLRNQSGATIEGTVSECNGGLALSPTPAWTNETDAYWYTDGAPFSFTVANDDSTLAAMNDALTAKGLDPARAQSFGAPLAADGSADRLVWYTDDNGTNNWIATFDADTGEFRTVDGDPTLPAETDSGNPSNVLIDLDQDGNLESAWGAGDAPLLMTEWATEEPTVTGAMACS